MQHFLETIKVNPYIFCLKPAFRVKMQRFLLRQKESWTLTYTSASLKWPSDYLMMLRDDWCFKETKIRFHTYTHTRKTRRPIRENSSHWIIRNFETFLWKRDSHFPLRYEASSNLQTRLYDMLYVICAKTF